MWDLVGNPEDRFSQNEAQITLIERRQNIVIQHECLCRKNICFDKALFFLILGLRIFFQNIKVGGGKKIKIKIT